MRSAAERDLGDLVAIEEAIEAQDVLENLTRIVEEVAAEGAFDGKRVEHFLRHEVEVEGGGPSLAPNRLKLKSVMPAVSPTETIPLLDSRSAAPS